ncbi:unnamed protein product [Psylliodes chrysocephalus]|uniref:Translocon-associated protein subunit delta n=1 Tax=Psylliodes chrysocephalus TaxID=3402493 RepID=A0A9P0D455_9CUCU|nr:unnamed protein product [Psylliodes chrysocephala]
MIFIFLISLIFIVTSAQNCYNPQIVSTSYTTQDATILKAVAFISNFYVKCETGDPGHFYAWLGETITPVASVGEGKYQISWTEEVKTAKTGIINVKVYNDTGYLALRKAIRAGEGNLNVPVFTTLKINHSGVYGGPWISCELLAAVFSIAVAYIAIHFRTKLLN